MRIAALLLSLALTAPALAQTRADPEAASGLTAKPMVTAERQMVVAAHPLASAAGIEMLRKGGSAADAAIATLLVLNVVEPQSSGIGGGGFAVVHGPDGVTSWDGRETAPMHAGPDWFLENGEPLPWLVAVASGRSVGTPGLVRLMEALHKAHGKLDWATLFEPAIRHAGDGFAVTPRLAASVAQYAGRLAAGDAGAVLVPGGTPVAEGVRLVQPELATTLARLAAEGAEAFYSGEIAAAITAATQAEPRPGGVTAEDLAAYRAIERPAACAEYRDRWRICGMGPPSSGATTVGQIMGLLSRFDVGDLGPDSPKLWHLFAEASRLAYADRAKYLGDSDFVNVPVKGLLDPIYLRDRARLIHALKAAPGAAEAGDPPWREGRLYAPDLQEDLPGTTHLSVIDADGLAISLTASIETAFGSGRMAAGFILNNQLTDFSFQPTDADGTPIANAPAAGKRPRSSMAPTIVYWKARPGTPYILAGSPGGSRIPEYVAQSLVGLLDLGLNPAEAAALGHVSDRNGDILYLETGAVPPKLAEGLAALGHSVAERDMTSGLHLIRITLEGEIQGGADPRREGVALGD